MKSQCKGEWTGVAIRVDDAKFELNQLLFADDAMLMADLGDLSQLLISILGLVCEKRKMKMEDVKEKWYSSFGRKGI